MPFKKYTCPFCGKVLAVGQLSGVIKCKKCGKPVNVIKTENSEGKAHQSATASVC